MRDGIFVFVFIIGGLSLKKTMISCEFCKDMNRMIEFKDELEQLGTTRNWYGFHICRFYWTCPRRETCKRRYVPIKRIL